MNLARGKSGFHAVALLALALFLVAGGLLFFADGGYSRLVQNDVAIPAAPPATVAGSVDYGGLWAQREPERVEVEVPTVAGTLMVYGDVVDVTGAPVKTTVILSVGSDRREFTSDTDGRFALTLQKADLGKDALAWVEDDHYWSAPTTVDFALGSGAPVHLIAYSSRLLLTGRVLSPSRLPAAGARVKCGLAETVTDTEGLFSVRVSADPGEIVVVAMADGVGRGSTTVMVDRRDIEAKELEIRLVASRPVSGRVVATSGHPLQGCVVSTASSGSPVATSDDSGRFIFPDLVVPGRGITILARKEGYVGASKWVEHSGLNDVTVVMELAGSVNGRVIDASGNAVEGAVVSIEGASQRAVTANDGGFSISGVKTGRGSMQRVSVSSANHAQLTEAIELLADTPIVLILENGEHLSGRIVSDQSAGVASAMITLQDRVFGPISRVVWTDRDGRFEVRACPRGVHALLVMAKGYQTTEVQIGPRRGVIPDLLLPAARYWEGEVIDAVTLLPLPAFSVKVTKWSVPPGSKAHLGGSILQGALLIAKNGRFRIDADRCTEATLIFWANGYAAEERQVVTNGESVDVRLSRGAKVRGVVRRESGSPVENCKLFAVGMAALGDSAQHSTTSGADGRFEFAGSYAGTGKVETRDARYGFASSGEVIVAVGGPDVDVTITLPDILTVISGVRPEILATANRWALRESASSSAPAISGDADGASVRFSNSGQGAFTLPGVGTGGESWIWPVTVQRETDRCVGAVPPIHAGRQLVQLQLSGANCEGCNLTLSLANGHHVTARVQANGSVEFPFVGVGDYVVAIDSEHRDAVWRVTPNRIAVTSSSGITDLQVENLKRSDRGR